MQSHGATRVAYSNAAKLRAPICVSKVRRSKIEYRVLGAASIGLQSRQTLSTAGAITRRQCVTARWKMHSLGQPRLVSRFDEVIAEVIAIEEQRRLWDARCTHHFPFLLFV